MIISLSARMCCFRPPIESKVTERSTFMGLTSARLEPIWMRSRITPCAMSSGVKFMGRHCERAFAMLRDLRRLNLASSESLSERGEKMGRADYEVYTKGCCNQCLCKHGTARNLQHSLKLNNSPLTTNFMLRCTEGSICNIQLQWNLVSCDSCHESHDTRQKETTT